MNLPGSPELSRKRPSRLILVSLYLFFVANVGRTLALVPGRPVVQERLGWILGLELAFLVVFSLPVWRPGMGRGWLQAVFAAQSALVVVLFGLAPELDFVTSLFILPSYQAAVYLNGRPRWMWISVFVALTGASSMVFLEPLRGLALGLVPQAGEIVLAAYIAASQEVVAAHARSQAMLSELRETNRQLELYASQVEELAVIEERNRLARQLHDSVSQTMFSIILNTRATQMLLEKDPGRVRPQLEQLQALVQSTLVKMRSLIAELRVKSE